MTTRTVITLWLAAFTGSCTSAEQYCPPSLRSSRSEDRCVRSPSSDPDPPSNDPDPHENAADANVGLVPIDEGPSDERGFDRDATETGPSATPQSDAGLSPEAFLDANQVDAKGIERGEGGNNDASLGDVVVPPSPQCAAVDLERWRQFQMSDLLLGSIASCYMGNPSCALGVCDLSLCLRATAGVTGCDACAAAEARCADTACRTECGSSTTSDACRACACRERCIGSTPACAMGPMDVCADCSGTSCNRTSFDPALNMTVVVNPIVLH